MDPNTISEGDPVWVRDKRGKLRTGPARFNDKGELSIVESLLSFVIARWDEVREEYVLVGDVKIIGHLPQLEFE